jgi:hypothetical protein
MGGGEVCVCGGVELRWNVENKDGNEDLEGVEGGGWALQKHSDAERCATTAAKSVGGEVEDGVEKGGGGGVDGW